MSGIERIAAERHRQQVSEGWTPEHDDQHGNGEMAKAACCYAWIAAQTNELRDVFRDPPPLWPIGWADSWWKPTTPLRDLAKAGALIAAEIDRLLRIEAIEDARRADDRTHEPDKAIGAPPATDGDAHACPVCAVAFKPSDVCAMDVELGTCHEECLRGSHVVSLETGEPFDGPIYTFRYGETIGGGKPVD